MVRIRWVAWAAAAVVVLAGCQSMVYEAWEMIGVEKRDLLVDRVEDARDARADAGEQFQTTLERFRSVVEFMRIPVNVNTHSGRT